MTREEIYDFCEMKAQMESENEDIYREIIRVLEQEPTTLQQIIKKHNMINLAYDEMSDFERDILKYAEQEPSGDMVSRGVFEQVMWERDVAIEQLKELGYGLGEKPKTGHWINVNEGKWNTIPAYKCSVCGANADLRDWSGESPFCPWCGARMIEPQERRSNEE